MVTSFIEKGSGGRHNVGQGGERSGVTALH
jgi:hypothetical protein